MTHERSARHALCETRGTPPETRRECSRPTWPGQAEGSAGLPSTNASLLAITLLFPPRSPRGSPEDPSVPGTSDGSGATAGASTHRHDLIDGMPLDTASIPF